MHPLRIALVHASDFGGGAERSVLTLHQTLRRMGHDSRLYIGSRQTDEPGVIEIPAVRTIRGMMRAVYWAEQNLGWQHLYAPRLRRWCRAVDPRPDVVHIHSLWGGQYGYADVGALPAISRRFPTVVTLREAWLTTGHCACPFACERWKNGCGRCPDLERAPAISRDATRFNWSRKRRAVARSSIHVTTISEWLRQQALQSPILREQPIHTIHNSVDEAVFRPGSRQSARQRLGIPEDVIVALMAGQTVEGINEGIAQQGVEALNRCRDVDVTALVIGKSAERVAGTLTIPTITLPFQSRPEEMATCYRAADVTIVTSEYEAFGRIAAESQMCGTPVLAFGTGGLTEVVREGVGGLVVPTGDSSALVQVIERLIQNPQERIRMGRDGAVWATSQFATPAIAQNYLALYQALIAERSCERQSVTHAFDTNCDESAVHATSGCASDVA